MRRISLSVLVTLLACASARAQSAPASAPFHPADSVPGNEETSGPAVPRQPDDSTIVMQMWQWPSYQLRHCRSGDGYSCEVLRGFLAANRHDLLPAEFGGDLKLSAASANAMHAECKTGNHLSCFHFMNALPVRAFVRDEGRFKELRITGEKRCGSGDWTSCLFLTAIAVRDRDDAAGRRAAAYFRKACETGYSPACGEEDPRSFIQMRYDDPRVLRVQRFEFETECARERSVACNMLGDAYSQGLGVTADWTRATEYYGKACDLEDEMGCQMLAIASLTGKVKGLGREDAMIWFKKACRLKSGYACSMLAAADWNPLSAPPKHPEATRKYLETACEQESNVGCGMLGLLYLHGFGLTADPKRARELLVRACELKSMEMCDKLVKLQPPG